VQKVHQIWESYEEKAVFLTIYLTEAHAQDQWPLGKHVQVFQHKTIQDRISVAKQFVAENRYTLPMVVDCMQNEFTWKYYAHPERFFVIIGGKLTFKANPQGAYYRLEDLEEYLLQTCM